MKLAVAQFEPKDGDKAYNLSVIEKLAKKAKLSGAEVISFHEMSITAYTFTKDLSYEEMLELAEEVPMGKSTQRLIEISKKYDIAILAGLVEKEQTDIYNTYICVHQGKIKAKFRKLHPFINPALKAGNSYKVFKLLGWKCGILICYDNNVIENVRATTLLGAELIFAPHVTGCTPSAMPGRDYVDDKFWQNREKDPVSLRLEFDGPKGRRWLMRWLPARAYDNGVYYAFTNPIGYDGEHLKNGNSMIIDPYGEVLTEVKSFEDEISIATLSKEKIPLSGGYRYRNARRPELYGKILGRRHDAMLKPVWIEQDEKEVPTAHIKIEDLKALLRKGSFKSEKDKKIIELIVCSERDARTSSESLYEFSHMFQKEAGGALTRINLESLRQRYCDNVGGNLWELESLAYLNKIFELTKKLDLNSVFMELAVKIQEGKI